MKRWMSLAVAFVVVAGASAAQAEGWLPIWNPFASSAPAMTRPGPTVWQQVARGTQNTLSGAGRMLNPWSTTSAAPAAQPLTGTRRVESGRPAKQKESSGWWWLPWSDEEELPHYDSPSEWLSQPRP